MCEQFEGIGITRNELQAGTVVMVALGRLPAQVHGEPCVIAPAIVMGPVSDVDRKLFNGEPEMWWLEVHAMHGVRLPQMYRVDEILGIPALSLDFRRVKR